MINETSIIVLNYNNYKDTKECIDSLLSIIYKDYNIILVDNKSTDGSGLKLHEYYGDKIIYIQSSKNIGYAAGNNIGIKTALDMGSKYICILNNDTVVYEDFLLCGIKYLASHADTAFVSPVLLNYSDLKIQSVGGDISLWTGGCITKLSKSNTIRYIGKQFSDIEKDVVSDYVGGACLLFKSELIREIGLIPENYFLFYEETEWCFKARREGKKCICLHEWAIKHKGSSSIDKISGLHEYMLERNRVVFEKRNTKSNFQFSVFLFILIIKTLISAIKDKEKIKYFRYYVDGITGQINKKYSYVYINTEGQNGIQI